MKKYKSDFLWYSLYYGVCPFKSLLALGNVGCLHIDEQEGSTAKLDLKEKKLE